MREPRYFSKSTLEALARKTLRKLHPNYLNREPQAVPLEQLIEDVFGLSIEYMRLTESGDELGRMIYDNGYTTRFNPETDNYELVKVTAGTILIDDRLLASPNLHGRFRFTLAHELGHWIVHKEHFTGTGIAAAAHELSAADDDAIEWQANYLAQAILMPLGQVKRGFYRLRMQSTERTTIHTLAHAFEVSKQAMEIRLQERNLI